MGEAPVLASSAGFRRGLTWGSVWVETLGHIQLPSGWEMLLLTQHLPGLERPLLVTTLCAGRGSLGCGGLAGGLSEAP